MFKFRFLLPTVLVLALLLPSTAFAGDLTDYASSYIDRFDEDMTKVNEVVEKANALNWDSDQEVSSFLTDLEGVASQLDESNKTVYSTVAPTNAPASLVVSVENARKGSAMIADAARKSAEAIRSSASDAVFNGAIDDFNAGVDAMQTAGESYDKFLDEYDATPSLENPFGILPVATPVLIIATIVLGVPTILISIYLLLAGSILNKKFRARLAPYLNRSDTFSYSSAFSRVSFSPLQATTAPLLTRGLARAYGIHLVVSVIFSYVVLLFSVVLMMDFAVLIMSVLWGFGYMPLGVVWAFGIIICASLWALLRALFAPIKDNTLGASVTDEDEPAIWALSRSVAEEIGTRPADRIIVTPQPMIGVREEGGLGSLLRRRSQRVLAVGMPSIVGLTVDQFSAILAHEYGHFSNRDTTWGPLTFRSGSALYGTMMQMRAMRHAGGLEGILSWLNPAPLALAGYIRIYMRLTSSFSRACEVLADQGAVSLYGRSAFKTGLRRVVVNDELFHSEFGPKMEELAMEGKSMENVFRLMEETESQATPERIEELYKKDEERPASKYDTHPPIGDRLSYVDHFEQKGSCTDTRPVSELFTDWQGRATQMSEMLSKHLIDTLN